eukprot:TRINITY_DN3562_c0_g1_i1.p1 TRINITY_DN3562_c0_g1~~TRINITY_DN3562_c0_g1_i1.p1  ORF type:complete len:413 (+),score=64.60 TRINITY_DN3562_c0_g1_i1:304-1542(+)
MVEQKRGFFFPFSWGIVDNQYKNENGQGFITHKVEDLSNFQPAESNQQRNTQIDRKQFAFDVEGSNVNKINRDKCFTRIGYLPIQQVVGREVELLQMGLLAVISGLGMELGKVRSGMQQGLNVLEGSRLQMLRDAMMAFQPQVPLQPYSKRKQLKQYKRQQKQARAYYDQGMAYVKDLRLKKAIEELEKAVQLEPNNVEYLAMLSKQWTDYTYVPGTPPDTIVEYNKKAIKLAEKCIDIDPAHPLGYIALCASQGRLALYSDNRTKAQLAKTARSWANVAVEKDPYFDYCHLVQGAWNYEMAGVNMVVRAIIRIVFGTNLDPGTYEDALECFKKAESLNPYRQLTQVQLGKTYKKLGREQECVDCLQRSLEMEIEDINEHLEQVTASQMLLELRPDLNCKQYEDQVPPHNMQ